MGKMYTLECTECEYELRAMLGGGTKSHDPDVIASCLVDKEDTLYWEQLNSMHPVKSVLTHHLCRCKDCNRLVITKEVKITFEGGETKTIGHKCTECKGSVDEIDIDEIGVDSSKIICPDCGKGVIKKKLTGFWD